MLAWLERFAELIIVTLLGIVSVATAYVSFQASLYDSKMFQEYAIGQSLKTEAESMYLEANQQYAQDAQTLVALDQLAVEMESSSGQIASLAQAKYDALYFGGVSEVFGEAIDRASAANDQPGADYVSPQEDEAYLDDLFGAYSEKNVAAEEKMKSGDSFNSLSDKLILYTVMMALSLFLLGVAAVVAKITTKFSISAIAMVIFTVTAFLSALVPFAAID
ncbi:MAG: hypothetical protein EBZ61_00350 [Micrococcales bacterium]|nr:hypothetical protein [Micrococcales bacterium]